jgi:hypothetical protein
MEVRMQRCGKLWPLALVSAALVGCSDDVGPRWGEDDPDAPVALWSVPNVGSQRPWASAMPADAGPASTPDGATMVPPVDPTKPFSDSIRLGFDVAVDALAVGQFTDDARLDLAVSDGSMLHVLAQTGPRSFMLERSIPLTVEGDRVVRDRLVVADLNSDGHDDVAVNLGNAVGIAYFRDGGLDPLVTSHVTPSGEVLDLAVGRFGESRRADLVVLTANEVSVFTELADGGFSAPTRVRVGDWGQRSLQLGDHDGDGLDDIVVLVTAGPASKLDCMLLNGRPTGGFLPPVFCGWTFEKTPQPTGLEDMVLADLDGDATDDVILQYGFPPQVSVLRRESAETYNLGVLGCPMLVGDLNADGRLDLVCDDRYELLLYLAGGSVGRLQLSTERAKTPERSEGDPTGALADLDGNGALDIVLGRSDGVHVVFQQRAGMTAEPPPKPGPDECVDDAQALPVSGCDPQCVRMPEACNGQDDDCDGAVDEGAAGYACGSALGECTPGQVVSCEAGSETCSGMTGQAESCDERDNDCDGQVDEIPECDPCAGDGSLAESVFATLNAHLEMLADVTCIQGQFQINGAAITDLSPLAKLEVVVGDMWIYNTTTLQTLTGLSSLSRVGRLFVRNNAALSSLAGIESLERIDTFHLLIDNNPALRSLDGLGGLVHVEDQVAIYENAELADIRGLSKLVSAAYVTVRDNPKLPQCQVDELVGQIETVTGCESCMNNGQGTCTP